MENLRKRAEDIRDESQKGRNTSKRVGGFMVDMLDYVNENSASLGVRKIYTSIAAMNADKTSPKGDDGRKLRFGQLVCIVTSQPEHEDNGKVYVFQDPGWKFVKRIGELAGYVRSEELEQVDIDANSSNYNVSVKHPTSGIDGTNKYTLEQAIGVIPQKYRSIGLKCSFLNEEGKPETWEYIGGSFINISSWMQGGANKLSELRTDLSLIEADMSTFKHDSLTFRVSGNKYQYVTLFEHKNVKVGNAYVAYADKIQGNTASFLQIRGQDINGAILEQVSGIGTELNFEVKNPLTVRVIIYAIISTESIPTSETVIFNNLYYGKKYCIDNRVKTIEHSISDILDTRFDVAKISDYTFKMSVYNLTQEIVTTDIFGETVKALKCTATTGGRLEKVLAESLKANVQINIAIELYSNIDSKISVQLHKNDYLYNVNYPVSIGINKIIARYTSTDDILNPVLYIGKAGDIDMYIKNIYLFFGSCVVQASPITFEEIKERLDSSVKLDWSGKIMATYGDSVVAINNGTHEKPYNKTKWGNIIAEYFNFSRHYGRGIGGQRFAWGSNGGAVTFVDAVGNMHSRNDSYSYDNYSGIIPVPEGTIPIRGCLCSWLRITTMFPQSIKDSVHLIMIMCHNDTKDNIPVTFIENNNMDKEWAASDQYSIYNGDYNINTLEGGIASTIMKLQIWMPNAIIVLNTCVSGRGIQGQLDMTLGKDQPTHLVSQVIREIGELMSIPVIDIYSNCGINGINRTRYISDGIHPYPQEGNNMLARAVIGGLKNIVPQL